MQFNLNRFFKLIKRDLIIYKRPMMLVLGGAAVLLFLISTMVYFGDENDASALNGDYWMVWATIMLMGGGYLFTSSVFWEFRNPDSRLGFLTTPASNMEKMLSRWIYSFILFPLSVMALTYLVYLVCKVLYPGVTWSGEDYRQYMRPASQIYLWCHGMLFMFAIWFNRYTAPKAAIVSFLLFIVTTICAAGLLYIVFNSAFDSPFGMTDNVNIEPNENFKLNVENNLGPLLLRISLIVPTIFFLVVSYFKMKEKEV